QQLLLHAALSSAEVAKSAWRQWCSEIDFVEDELDLGSFRLLPLVYYNLRKVVPDDPLMPTLRGIHHRSWVQTQLQIEGCTEVLARFQDAGIEPLLLKGLPLALRYYPTLGTRPMGDVDVLVPRSQVYDAINLLTELGWQPGARSVASINDNYLAMRHAHDFSNDKGQAIDLHWHVLINSMNSPVDASYWQDAVPLTVNEVATRAPDPTDLLLHVCVHGIAWAPIPPIRWVADAVSILRKAQSQIDWERLTLLAAQSQTSLQLHMALDFLNRLDVEVKVPDEALDELQRVHVSPGARRIFAAQTQRTLLLGHLPVLWARYQSYAARQRSLPKGLVWLGFPGYVAAYYELTTPMDVVRWTLTRIVKRFTLWLSRGSRA
ncbi:MAG: nucleotidyltransferase family protein, partial [Caldilineaceae bacterium]|nr:nucleotidyltransferase family protein [Caldilineaceae bacterium]